MIKLIQKEYLLLLSVCFLMACGQEPKPIQYGTDSCHFCRMTIVDKLHGAEIVTDKGKVFKFDAAECLLNYKKELESTEDYLFLTNHFESPGKFVNMKKARYLISEELPSPMGAYLTAFETQKKVEELKNEKGGEIYTFKEIQAKFQ